MKSEADVFNIVANEGPEETLPAQLRGTWPQGLMQRHYPPDTARLAAFAGLALGAIYVLLALGLSLIFGMLGVVNFAHGALFMVGAYVGAVPARPDRQLLGGAGDRCRLAVGAVGLVVERFLVRPLYGRPDRRPAAAHLRAQLRDRGGRSASCSAAAGMPFETPELLHGALDIGVGFFPTLSRCSSSASSRSWCSASGCCSSARASGSSCAPARATRPSCGCSASMSAGSGCWCSVSAPGSPRWPGCWRRRCRASSPEMGVPVLAEAFVVTVVGGMGSLLGAVIAGLLVGVVISMTALFAPEMAKVVDLRADGAGPSDAATGPVRASRRLMG